MYIYIIIRKKKLDDAYFIYLCIYLIYINDNIYHQKQKKNLFIKNLKIIIYFYFLYLLLLSSLIFYSKKKKKKKKK